jgi:hypothetical protein
MDEVVLPEKSKEERTRGKRGIKSKATIRNNAYDRMFHTHQATLTFPDVCSPFSLQKRIFKHGTLALQETDVPYSLNKGKRWEQVAELKQQIADGSEAGNDQVAAGNGMAAYSSPPPNFPRLVT